MDKSMFDELLASVQEMNGIAKGDIKAARETDFPDPEVKSIRERIGLSQGRFDFIIGVSKRTLENWKQGRRQPTGAAKTLLRIFAVDPEGTLKALHG